MRSSEDTEGFRPVDFKTRFPALDGIRALAVTMVFALHYGGGTHGGFALRMVNAVRLRGGVGVDLFFVLSGFLITGILYDTRGDSRFLVRFFARRSIRIFPVFYLVFAILLLLTPFLRYEWKPGHLAFPLYLGNFAMALDPSLERVEAGRLPAAAAHFIHLWSLCVEEQFYLLWPFVIWHLRDRMRILRAALLLCFAAFALRVAFVVSIPPRYDEGWMFHLLPFRMDALLAGAILALCLRGPNAAQWQRSCKWLFVFSTGLVLAICILSPDTTSPWFATLGLSAVAAASAGLIGTSLRTGSAAFRVFSLRPLRGFGKYSYGFYVYHLIWAGGWTSLAEVIAMRLHSSVAGNAIALAMGFIATFLISKLSYDYFEVRFLHLKRRFEYDSEVAERTPAFDLK